MRKLPKSEATTYRVVKLGDDYQRVFSEREWASLSPDDQAQYDTIRAGIATRQEAEAEIRPAQRPSTARAKKSRHREKDGGSSAIPTKKG
jgi:hypothetical protein